MFTYLRKNTKSVDLDNTFFNKSFNKVYKESFLFEEQTLSFKWIKKMWLSGLKR